jgi:hypothetical protein
LGKAFNNSGLTNARFTDKDWVVFRTAGENLHYALDFFLASDYWIEFSFAGCDGEVSSELI